MAELTGRDLHLVKKALSIAVLAIERQPRSFQSISDRIELKALVDDQSTMIWNLVHCPCGADR